jgi:hypothetical protein
VATFWPEPVVVVQAIAALRYLVSASRSANRERSSNDASTAAESAGDPVSGQPDGQIIVAHLLTGEKTDIVLIEANAMADERGLAPKWLSNGVIDTIHRLAPDEDPIELMTEDTVHILSGLRPTFSR